MIETEDEVEDDWCVLICKHTESYQVVNKDIILQGFVVEYCNTHNVYLFRQRNRIGISKK